MFSAQGFIVFNLNDTNHCFVFFLLLDPNAFSDEQPGCSLYFSQQSSTEVYESRFNND